MVTAAEIVSRAESGWPYNAVPYSQTDTWSDGYRMDCSGFASMAAALPTPGLSTVTFLTTGAVTAISWADLAAGDFVGALGPGTAGDAGHIMVVESVDHAGGTYTVLEQAGYGPGPDRNTYGLGDGQGRNYLPYRLTNLEEDMAVTDAEQCRIALLAIYGATDQGYEPLKSIDPVAAKAISEHNVFAVETRLMAKLDGLAAAIAALQSGAPSQHEHPFSGTTGPAQ